MSRPRSAEVLGLAVADVDIPRGWIQVMGKGGKERRVPLDPDVAGLIQAYLLAERPETASRALFVVAKGPHRGQPLTAAGLRTIFHYHRGKTAVPAGHPHATQVMDGASRHRGPAQQREAALGWEATHAGLHNVMEDRPVGYPGRRADEPPIGEQLWNVQRTAEAPEQPIVACGDHHPAIGGLKHSYGAVIGDPDPRCPGVMPVAYMPMI